LESSHGGSYRRPEGMTTWHEEYQLFQPSGAIKFPLQVTDAWIEKVYWRSIWNSKIINVCFFMRCAIS
jgi:hypothetical protein